MHQEENKYRTECTVLLQLFQEDCMKFSSAMMKSKSKEEKLELIKNYTEKTDNYLERFISLSNLLDPNDPFRNKMLDSSIPMIDFNNSDVKALYEKYLTLPPDADPMDYENP